MAPSQSRPGSPPLTHVYNFHGRRVITPGTTVPPLPPLPDLSCLPPPATPSRPNSRATVKSLNFLPPSPAIGVPYTSREDGVFSDAGTPRSTRTVSHALTVAGCPTCPGTAAVPNAPVINHALRRRHTLHPKMRPSKLSRNGTARYNRSPRSQRSSRGSISSDKASKPEKRYYTSRFREELEPRDLGFPEDGAPKCRRSYAWSERVKDDEDAIIILEGQANRSGASSGQLRGDETRTSKRLLSMGDVHPSVMLQQMSEDRGYETEGAEPKKKSKKAKVKGWFKEGIRKKLKLDVG